MLPYWQGECGLSEIARLCRCRGDWGCLGHLTFSRTICSLTRGRESTQTVINEVKSNELEGRIGAWNSITYRSGLAPKRQLGRQWRERKCPIFEMVPKGDSNLGSLDCESSVLPLNYRAPLSSVVPLYFPGSCTSPFLFHIGTIRPILHSFGIIPSCIHTFSSLHVHS